MEIGPSHKACNRCGVVKPLEDYYMTRTRVARANMCKQCANEKTKEYRAARPDHYKEVARVHARNRRAAGVKYPSELAPSFSAAKIASVKKYRAAHPLKAFAQTTAANAMRAGKLVRQPCEVCGTTIKIHGHHDDYSKPLDVRWLCVTHHAEHHRLLRKRANEHHHQRESEVV